MSVETTKIQEGDALVNESGRSVVVENVDGDTVICDDSNFSRQQTYDRENIRDGIEQGHFRVVRDSSLTAIKGIGESTAPIIEAKTGCETPSELVESYLTEPDSGVRNAVRRTDYLNQWIQDNITDLDTSVSLAKLRVMLFLIEYGCSPSQSHLSDIGEITTKYHNSIKEEKVTVNHLQWDDDGVWVGSSQVACVARGMDGLTELQSTDVWERFEQCANYERDGNYICFISDDGNETWVSWTDYIERLQSIFTFDSSDVMVHPEGEYPVYVADQETELIICVAPRIR